MPTVLTTHPAVLKIFTMLEEANNLRPSAAQHDLEEVMVTQITHLLDEVLPWQCGHSRRTAQVARRLGAAAGFSSETLHQLTLAALLHDIGLLALSSDLASHAEYLDVQSYADRQCHPRLGALWLEPYPFLRQASVIIAHHHERWDGSGYPYGFRGTFIPVEARILAIADTFDAIKVPGATNRATRDRVAYRILTVTAGTQFDPELVEICSGCLHETDTYRTAEDRLTDSPFPF